MELAHERPARDPRGRGGPRGSLAGVRYFSSEMGVFLSNFEVRSRVCLVMFSTT